MTVEWHRAPVRRIAFFADHAGERLYVQQTPRALRVGAIIGDEFQVLLSGNRVGEFEGLETAQRAAIAAAETKKAPQGEPRGHVYQTGVCFDY